MVENWDGPPTGYDWKQFLASVRLVRFTKLDRRPWLRTKNGDKEKPQDQSRTINQIAGHSLASSVSALQIYHFETFHNRKFSHMSTLKPEVV